MTDTPKTFLHFLPVSLFGAIMGLTGLTFAWGWAEKMWGFSSLPKDILGALSAIAFVALSITYLIKLLKYPSLVKADFKHPVSVSFFGLIIITLLLIPGLIHPWSPKAAAVVWIIGATMMFVFAVYVLRTWLDHPQDPGNAMPAWAIPVVGTLDAPIVGYRLDIPGIHEICLMFFGIGLLFTIILITIIFSRLIFQPPLPEPLRPTLLILAAPFALALSNYHSLTGSIGMFGSLCYYLNLFFLLIFGGKILLIPRCCPFRVTWWAVSFPLVASTIAAFRYAEFKHHVIFKIVSGSLLAISTIVIGYLVVQTLYKMITGKLFLTKPAAEQATETLQPTAK